MTVPAGWLWADEADRFGWVRAEDELEIVDELRAI
jgi:hypothetical protein